jgi:hypothetical protein
MAEIRRLPAGWLDEVLEAKAYRTAKSIVDAADTKEAKDRIPHTPLFSLVKEITQDVVLEEMERRRANG